jgi:hypothetical protein
MEGPEMALDSWNIGGPGRIRTCNQGIMSPLH